MADPCTVVRIEDGPDDRRQPPTKKASSKIRAIQPDEREHQAYEREHQPAEPEPEDQPAGLAPERPCWGPPEQDAYDREVDSTALAVAEAELGEVAVELATSVLSEPQPSSERADADGGACGQQPAQPRPAGVSALEQWLQKPLEEAPPEEAAIDRRCFLEADGPHATENACEQSARAWINERKPWKESGGSAFCDESLSARPPDFEEQFARLPLSGFSSAGDEASFQRGSSFSTTLQTFGLPSPTKEETTSFKLYGVPPMMTRQLLKEQFDSMLPGGSYDFLCVPKAYATGKPAGYAFVNFVSPRCAQTALPALLQSGLVTYAEPCAVEGSGQATADARGLEAARRADGQQRLEPASPWFGQPNAGFAPPYRGDQGLRGRPGQDPDAQEAGPFAPWDEKAYGWEPGPAEGCWEQDAGAEAADKDLKVLPAIRSQLHKTQLCKFHSRNLCALGKNCSYAHSTQELQKRPDLTKTRLCYLFKNGQCVDANCKFAHDYQDLRATSNIYKTKICRAWRVGGCRAGNMCRYAHGTRELKRQEAADADEEPWSAGGGCQELGGVPWPGGAAPSPAPRDVRRSGGSRPAVAVRADVARRWGAMRADGYGGQFVADPRVYPVY